jgi:hypothetical protein
MKLFSFFSIEAPEGGDAISKFGFIFSHPPGTCKRRVEIYALGWRVMRGIWRQKNIGIFSASIFAVSPFALEENRVD